MILKKGLYKLIRGVGGITLFLGILYPLRWTLFEGVVKDRIREVAREKVQSDVVFGSLEGSLLFGIEAKNIIFVPKEGSPLKKATFGEILVEYGFLGMGTPKVTINGALVMMEPPPEESVPEPPTQTESAPSKPVYKIVQSVIKELHRFEFPGEFYLKDLLFVLSDGSEIDLQQAGTSPHGLESETSRGHRRTSQSGGGDRYRKGLFPYRQRVEGSHPVAPDQNGAHRGGESQAKDRYGIQRSPFCLEWNDPFRKRDHPKGDRRSPRRP